MKFLIKSKNRHSASHTRMLQQYQSGAYGKEYGKPHAIRKIQAEQMRTLWLVVFANRDTDELPDACAFAGAIGLHSDPKVYRHPCEGEFFAIQDDMFGTIPLCEYHKQFANVTKRTDAKLK